MVVQAWRGLSTPSRHMSFSVLVLPWNVIIPSSLAWSPLKESSHWWHDQIRPAFSFWYLRADFSLRSALQWQIHSLASTPYVSQTFWRLSSSGRCCCHCPCLAPYVTIDRTVMFLMRAPIFPHREQGCHYWHWHAQPTDLADILWVFANEDSQTFDLLHHFTVTHDVHSFIFPSCSHHLVFLGVIYRLCYSVYLVQTLLQSLKRRRHEHDVISVSWVVFLRPLIHIPIQSSSSIDSLITISLYRLKRNGDGRQPCRKGPTADQDWLREFAFHSNIGSLAVI